MRLIIEGSWDELRHFIGATLHKIDSVHKAPEITGPLGDRNRKKISSVLTASGISGGSNGQKKEYPVSVLPGKSSCDKVPDRIKFVFSEPEPFQKKGLTAIKIGKMIIYQKDGVLNISREGYKCSVFGLLSDLRYLNGHPLEMKPVLKALPYENKRVLLRAFFRDVIDLSVFDSVQDPAELLEVQQDRTQMDDPDRAFRPMLSGAFSTRTNYDAAKVGEEL